MSRVDPEVVRAVELSMAGDKAASIRALEQILRSKPRSGPAHAALGDILAETGRLGDALEHYARALSADPRFPAIHVRRTQVLIELHRFEEAEAAAQAAVRAEPSNFGAHAVRVRALQASGNLVDAAEFAVAALRLRPESTELAVTAGMALTMTGSASRAVELLKGVLKSRPDSIAVLDGLCTAYPYSASATQKERVECAKALGRAVYARLPRGEPPPITDPDPERPLRIGYIAQDISGRSVIAFFIEAAFEFHDRERFPITCYLTQKNMGVMTPGMLGHLASWVDVGAMTDEDLAARIRADRIDILVDLAGTTPGHRLKALVLRPAPIIVNAIGCPTTTGIPCVDYRFVDGVTDPPGYERDWTEKLVRLPGCFLCYRPPDDAPPARPPRAPDAPITFGSFNSVQKLGLEVVALWSRVLKQVTDSRLLLKAPGFAHPRTRAAFLKRFAQYGVEPDRVEIVTRIEDYLGHLELYHRVDIGLDPFPYCGTTTLCESMWMGVPYITLLGEGHPSRVGASLLTAVGLGELIAKDAEDYVRLAAGLAADPGRLSALHTGLRERMARSVLCDGAAHARAVESAFREMWRARCAEGTRSD